MSVRAIQTFGYEGLRLSEFIDRLVETGTEAVIDVRANPLSRKPGFSKKALALSLATAGIEYVHAPKMGCPKHVRDRYKTDGDWNAYTKGFLSHIAWQKDAVVEVALIAERKHSCLICFEADFNFCHRAFVARAVAKVAAMSIVHLTGRGSFVESSQALSAA